MIEQVERFAVDLDSLEDFYGSGLSAGDVGRKRAFLEGWKRELEGVALDGVDAGGRADYVMLRNHVEREAARLSEAWEKVEGADGLVPFRKAVVELLERRRSVAKVEGKVEAAALEALAKEVEAAREALGERSGTVTEAERVVANRAAGILMELKHRLGEWMGFYKGYDPIVSWWCGRPFEKLDAALGEYRSEIRRELLGVGSNDDDPVVGDPIGREALLRELGAEFISYTPEELVAIAEREFAWCEAEMLKASREMGFGEDWRAAMGKVKDDFVAPGEQPYLIKELALEAIGFLKERDLVTIPALCEETWEMRMMSPERQKVSPYFLGGQTIMVSFPTDGMEHSSKLMSLRGNNRHFARATVHHELIPGHHLQLYMAKRYAQHRELFRTPFFVEGWALYWELLLWEKGFQKSPENRVGMLFWRMHRCARILFSLKFHLGEMTAPEAIDFLVERVGHERANATGEVRRSVGGAYPPLYQAAYLLGGLQLMALREELVDGGVMGEKAFHDALLREGSVPIEMMRVILKGEEIGKDFEARWEWGEGKR